MKLFLHILLIFFAFSSWAQEDLSKLSPMTARAFFKNELVKPGALNDLQMEVQLQDGFFAYHDRFSLIVLTPEEAVTGELFIDPIVEFDDKISKKRKKGVKGSATISTQIEIPAQISTNLKSFKMELTYIACTKKFCLTPRTITLGVPVQLAPSAETTPETDIASSAYIQQQIANNLAYALLLIFLFGLLTSLTPCVYPLISITWPNN